MWLFREGRNNASLIHTGEDVTLKCSVLANPAHHTIQWTKQVNTIELATELREISHLLHLDICIVMLSLSWLSILSDSGVLNLSHPLQIFVVSENLSFQCKCIIFLFCFVLRIMFLLIYFCVAPPDVRRHWRG